MSVDTYHFRISRISEFQGHAMFERLEPGSGSGSLLRAKHAVAVKF